MKRILALILAVSAIAAVPAFAQKSYKLADRVKLGGEGGWDYLTYDSDGQPVVHHSRHSRHGG